MTPPFHTHKQSMRATYGAALYRVPVDLGLGCPHRHADGSGGCAFCPAHGSRATQTLGLDGIENQVRAGIAFARNRYRATRFMAYVQAFTGTRAAPERQRELYNRILAVHPFDAISIGTRPDCLGPATLAILDDLNTQLDVWVDLGIQTTHDETLARINRGHDWAAGRTAIETLAAHGIKVAAHVILALPGESTQHFRRTAERLAALPVAAIKIHNLHVVKNTALAAEYARTPFPTPDAHAYADILIDFLRRLPPTMVIMRINTDTPADQLIAPHWTMDKARFRNHVVAAMIRRDVKQGDLVEGN